MIDQIIQWIMTNLNTLCSAIVIIPIVCAFGIGAFFIVDDQCQDYRWYGKIMYGGGKRDDTMAEQFFGKAFLTLGIAHIVVPCLVVYGYMYLTNITLAQFVKNSTGG